MKIKLFLVLVIIGLSFLVACNNNRLNSSTSSLPFADDGKLTSAKAKNAVEKWMGSNGSVSVQGIQEIEKENIAKADISFNNFKFKAAGLFGQNERNYSGPGEAIFTHYNDGRWVLTKVSTQQGFDSAWWDNLSVEAR